MTIIIDTGKMCGRCGQHFSGSKCDCGIIDRHNKQKDFVYHDFSFHNNAGLKRCRELNGNGLIYTNKKTGKSTIIVDAKKILADYYGTGKALEKICNVISHESYHFILQNMYEDHKSTYTSMLFDTSWVYNMLLGYMGYDGIKKYEDTTGDWFLKKYPKIIKVAHGEHA